MNDLLWLTNHPLRGNVAGIPTSQDPDTPEGIESWLSIGIHRILAKLPHSTELELRKLHQTQMDSGRASTLELLRGLLTSREFLRPLEPRLSLSTLERLILEAPWGELHLTFFTLSTWGSTMVFIEGVRRCSDQRLGVWGPFVRPTDHVSSLHHLWPMHTLSTTSAGHIDKMVFGNVPTHGQPAKVMWPVGHTLPRLNPCFVPRHFLVLYFLWLCLILHIMKICMNFCPYDAFLSSDVPEMVDQQNSCNLLVISTYLLYLE
jgi:hypothetical protein